jgi:phage shock protein PspC (stress-responsive transcriptional regulator)
MNKKIFKRSKTNRKLFGICGGLAEYTGTDPLIWRLLFVGLIFTPFPMAILYIFTTLITDNENE